MKKYILLLIVPFLSFGQGWVQTYDYQTISSVLQISDGGFIITGQSNNDELCVF